MSLEADQDADHVGEIGRNVSRLAGVASADAVVGPVQQVEGRLIVPLASVSTGYGFGGGWGSSPEEDRGGGGGGAKARPVATLEITATEFRVHQVVDSTRITIASLLLAGWTVFWITRTIRAFRRR
ncbi:MAG: spore germination protein GerW family protein [Chloroflexi bacterium]|nr:spore germination protein GerW family protein [Chloroflexota bacterium]